MKLGERLRELRQIRGLRQNQLADQCHISNTYLCDLEKGRTLPRMDTLATIAQALNTTVPDILFDVDELGTLTPQAMAPGLVAMIEKYGPIDPKWLELLGKIEVDGKRPQTHDDWFEVYLHLKSKLETTP